MSENFHSMKHLKLEPLPKGLDKEMLQKMFELQLKLFNQYPYAKEYSQEQLTALYATAIASEAQELMEFCNWKPWKKNKKEFDKTETIYEYIDCLHFVINGLIALEVGPEECMQYYLSKNKENQSRIERGY